MQKTNLGAAETTFLDSRSGTKYRISMYVYETLAELKNICKIMLTSFCKVLEDYWGEGGGGGKYPSSFLPLKCCPDLLFG